MILGLGSNVGDRLANLRKAVQTIKNTPGIIIEQVSPVYLSDALLPEGAPSEWDMSYLNIAVRCETIFAPLELLNILKAIESSIGRKPETRHWGPRILDIDILAWDELVIQSETLTLPHANLQERPFALWPLADVAALWTFPLAGPNHGKTAAQIVEKWGSRFTGEAPLRTKQIYHRVDTPELVGILNVTPDSFSDGGKYFSIENALNQALSLVNSGANVIDIGAESTAPNATRLDAKREWERLEPVLLALTSARNRFLLPPKLSVDTRHAEVAIKALAIGVNWINDVTGLQDPAMRDVLRDTNVDCVVMHHMSIPASRDFILPRNQDAVELVYKWAVNQLDILEQSGIKKERIILDPGIGFGKTAEHSLQLIKHIEVFQKLGVRLLIGHSRKSFLSLLTDRSPSERDIETVAISLYLAKQNINYLRIHQVEMCARALRTMAVL